MNPLDDPDGLTDTMKRALVLIDRWAGDLSLDFEDDIGAHGAACDAVIGGLIRRNMIFPGAHGTYCFTERGLDALTRAKATRLATPTEQAP